MEQTPLGCGRKAEYQVTIRIFTLVLVASAVTSFALAQQTPAGDASKSNAELESDLLDQLGGDLLEGLDDIPLDDALDIPSGDAEDSKTRQLLDQLEGEDIQPSGENELTRIGRQMQLVKERIVQQEVSGKTQALQEQIVADLDALIKQLQQRKKQQQGSSSQQPQPKNQKVKQPDQPDTGQEKPSDQPARDSQERLGSQEAKVADMERVRAMIKQVWGHLPERARQEMNSATVEEFLPKYEQLIEDYFRRLAEEESTSP